MRHGEQKEKQRSFMDCVQPLTASYFVPEKYGLAPCSVSQNRNNSGANRTLGCLPQWTAVTVFYANHKSLMGNAPSFITDFHQ
ncbi:hypothetical protein CDAR_225021 [Caerostris darwini]|uniref:Uncharacterized protein n=1 Tax=Caerostris darwini TaxID=1538125 RepID=A0AAV4T700_9ARAC|nr:hypothetical protein CDAR_225021 [Caerostris darwini]